MKTRTNSSFRPMVEVLEDRLAPTVGISVANLVEKPGSARPNGNLVLVDLNMRTVGGPSAQLKDVWLTPALHSELLAQNTHQLILRVDANGLASDGCEKIVAVTQADPATDVVHFHLFDFSPTWLHVANTHLEVDAALNYSLTGPHLGAELADVAAVDVHGNAITNVTIKGAATTLHNLQYHSLTISQSQMAPAQTVLVGTTQPLIQFWMWGSGSVSGKLPLKALKGSLTGDVSDEILVHRDWNNVIDKTLHGIVSGNTLTFNLSSLEQSILQGGTWEVDAKMGNHVGAVVQLGFGSITATDAITGKALRGFIHNGLGTGQVLLWDNPVNATVYTIVAPSSTVSKPSVILSLPNGASGSTASGLTVGNVRVASVTVAASSQGDIKVNSIPLVFTGNAAGTHISPFASLVVRDSIGVTIPIGLSGTNSGTSLAMALVTFPNGYLIPAGQSQTFTIEVDVSALAGTVSDSVSTGLGSTDLFTWTDIAGNGIDGAELGTLIFNFPTNSVAITN